MVRPATLVYFYRKRLRVHAMQELLAGVGIAIGVMLVFGVFIVNASISGGARQIIEGTIGDATLQVTARSATGFDARRIVPAANALPGVERTAAMFWQRASIVHDGRRVAVSFGGFGEDFSNLRGIGTRQFGRSVRLRGVTVTATAADRLGLVGGEGPRGGLPDITLELRGRAERVAVEQVLRADQVGPLVLAPFVAGSLDRAQRLGQLPGRATYLYVVPRPGRERLARAGLERLAEGRLTVARVPEDEVRSLALSIEPITNSRGMFAVISALLGLLLASAAMLLTVPERRRFVAELRVLGFARGRVVQILVFQAIVLGVLASAVGLPLGYLLAGSVVRHPPGYLTFAYPVSTTVTVTWGMVATAFVAGVVTSCLAAAQPLLDLRRRDRTSELLAHRGEAGQTIGAGMRRLLVLGWVSLLVVSGLLLVLEPSRTILTILTIAAATVLAIPSAFALVLTLSDRLASRWRLNSLALAVRALRATPLRSHALVATGAVSIFVAVWLQGAYQNLLTALHSGYHVYVGTADLWIAQPGDDLGLLPFAGGDVARRVAAVPGVREVRDYGGGLLDIGRRRTWVIARPSGDATMVSPDQVVAGDTRGLTRRLRSGGWITVSREIAADEGVAPGDVIRLPTPTGPVAYRVAATTTNFGWGAGAIVMNRDDQRRAWGSDDPTALEVDLVRGADPPVVQREIRRALGPRSGLVVQTSHERAMHGDAVGRDTLAGLGQVIRLVLVAAALSVAAAMGTGIWQRRATLAQLRVMGWRPAKLWRALLCEAALVLGTASVVGAVAGMYCHFVGNRWLEEGTGYLVPFEPLPGPTAVICLLVSFIAIAIAAVPGAIVSRTPPRVGLDA